MKTVRCLYCYQSLSASEMREPAGQAGYHTACSRKMFGLARPPELPYTEDEMLTLAEQIVKSQKTVTGVQPKLSLSLQKADESWVPAKLTIVGLWGEYILKPPTNTYPQLPEIEDLTMHLAERAKIKTVSHTLIYLKSGQLAYLTRRVDRHQNRKFHMEDMCQLTERLTEHKYKGSYEQIAKAIIKYSTNPGLDVINFYELVLFSFLTGNNDMHLKNFSLLKDTDRYYHLCPAYDLLASALVVEGDDEELALTLNGKKKKLRRDDFETAMKRAGIADRAIQNIFKKLSKNIPAWHKLIDISFLDDSLKTAYHEMLTAKQHQLGLE